VRSQLGENTWTDIEQARPRVVVAPLGALEQHGHHLPLLTDALIGGEVARRAELELKDEALFLPMLWAGASGHHLSFPGTVSISALTYVQVINYILESLIEGGFRRIVFLNAHAGNGTPVRLAMNEVQIRHRRALPDLWLSLVNWFELIAPPAGWKQTKIIHAGEWETSAIQAVRPELVKTEAITATQNPGNSRFYRPDYSKPGPVDIARTIEQNSATGAFGFPEAATPEKGEALFSEATREFVSFVREFARYQSDPAHQKPQS
jgi:creatinine amidohydrolase